MVLGNTFHLFIQPGAEHIAAMGGLHEFMGWRRPIITDSGGFQVFSMGHGSVAEEIKGNRGQRKSRVLSIDEEGVRFRSYLDGSERFMGPETSMEVQASLGSDIALAFDECTPFHVERDYTARSAERTHRWLDRCIDWQRAERAGRPAPVRHRAGRRLRGPEDGIRRAGGELGRGRCGGRRLARPGEGADAGGGGVGAPAGEGRPAAPPARDRRRGRHPARRGGGHRHLRLRHADAPRPPRHGARAAARVALAARPHEARRSATAASRSTPAVPARPAASTRAATCTTWPAPASSPPSA